MLMKIIKTILLVIFIVGIGCSQVWVPKGLEWEYDYTGEVPSDIRFHIFRASFLGEENYMLFDSTQALVKGFNLDDQVMYDNRNWYFFCRAKRISDGAVSLNSDTVYAFFPKILANEPYEFKMLKTKVP